MTRRRFLVAAGSATWSGSRLVAGQGLPVLAGGRYVASLPLDFPAAGRVPLETDLGAGLDRRFFTDLSQLTSDTLITRNESFFVRTASPRQLPAVDQWSIPVGGLIRAPARLTLAAIERDTRPAGVHLMECSGNSAPTFALLSAAAWEGAPLASILDRNRPLAAATHVMVSGIDDPDAPSSTSVPGASWVFSREALERAGAFLATRMNRQPLPREHGGPVRLVVPGWYGCVCIKWVNEIALVNDETSATLHMREFAARTNQTGEPRLARDFVEATLDTAAMPVRVEHWRVDTRPVYRVVGIIWGGSQARNDLIIRFNPDEPFVRVDDCPMPPSTTTWSLWSHLWTPREAGRYRIALRIADRDVRTRRLDRSYYAREISISEV